MAKFLEFISVLLFIALFMVLVAPFVSCSTPKASWGKGDGMNHHCQNKYVSNRVPFNFN
jgi:hypothetical protein